MASVRGLILLAIGILMLGVLVPVGLAQWESYTPTDSILVIIWPIGAVIIVIGIVMRFLPGGSKQFQLANKEISDKLRI